MAYCVAETVDWARWEQVAREVRGIFLVANEAIAIFATVEVKHQWKSTTTFYFFTDDFLRISDAVASNSCPQISVYCAGS